MYLNNITSLTKNYEISCEDGLKIGVDNLLNPHLNIKNNDWKSNGIPSNVKSNTNNCKKIISYTDKNNTKQDKNLFLNSIKNTIQIKNFFYPITILLFICFISFLIKKKINSMSGIMNLFYIKSNNTTPALNKYSSMEINQGSDIYPFSKPIMKTSIFPNLDPYL